MVQAESALLQQANGLFFENRWQESKIKFQELIDGDGSFVAEGYRGLAFVEKALNNNEEATYACEQALAIDPTMKDVDLLLAQLAPSGVYGPYEFLRERSKLSADRSQTLSGPLGLSIPLAQDALILMNQLRVINDRRPSASAYLVQFMPFLFASLGLLFSLIISLILFLYLISQLLPGLPTAIDLLFGFIPFIVAALVCSPHIVKGLWRFQRLRNTRYTIAQGRIYVKVGVLRDTTRPYELFRIRRIDLERPFWNKLTKDGTLVIDFEIERGEPQLVMLTGLAHGKELDDVHRKLMDLVGLLRNIPDIKGLIQ